MFVIIMINFEVYFGRWKFVFKSATSVAVKEWCATAETWALRWWSSVMNQQFDVEPEKGECMPWLLSVYFDLEDYICA